MDGNRTDVARIVGAFTEFFRQRGHQPVTGATLIPPPGDPVLFTTSGMHPLTPYLEGRPHPGGPRLAGRQRCLRTTDLDEVGDPWHLTVFEMLGTWSLGDYDGPQSLRWCHELVTGPFGVDPGRLHATVFGGDDQTGPDTELERTWERLGVPVERTTADNWWSNGETGLCGPDSELFTWTGDGPPHGMPSGDSRWVELWNHVMLRYDRQPGGRLVPLSRPAVDTGMGLERLLMVLQGRESVYQTDVFAPWLGTLPGLWDPGVRDLRLLADHLRSGIVVIADGVLPSSTGRGYVLRRLVRRVLTALWREDRERTLASLPEELVSGTLGQFGLDQGPGQVRRVREVLGTEEGRFGRLLDRGRLVLAGYPGQHPLSQEDLRYLHQTHGLPPGLVSLLRSQQ